MFYANISDYFFRCCFLGTIVFIQEQYLFLPNLWKITPQHTLAKLVLATVVVDKYLFDAELLADNISVTAAISFDIPDYKVYPSNTTQQQRRRLQNWMIVLPSFLSKLFPKELRDRSPGYMCVWKFDIDGFDESATIKELSISWAELRRWQKDERFPKTDVKVLAWIWKSAGKYQKLALVDGWSQPALDAAKPNIEAWRREHVEDRKASRKQSYLE
jgi:hypothetical protein